MRTLRALFLVCIAFTLSVPASAREWLRADAPGFVVYSDGYPQELERWTRKVVMFDALLKSLYGGGDDQPGSPLTIFLLSDGKQVAGLVGRKNLTGFYRSDSEGSFAIASRSPAYFRDRLSGQMTLFHEYGHHFMYRHFPGAYPTWFSEGFAEYVSTISFDMDWRWTFGQPATERLKYLRKDPLPIETILTASVDDFPSSRKARFYAWAWRLVQVLNSRPERKAQLRRYLELYAGGAPPMQAARVFGDLDKLEAELQAEPVGPPGPVAAHSPVAAVPEIAVRPLEPTASRLIELRLARLARRNDEQSLGALRSLAAARPDDAAVLIELAQAEREAALKDPATDFASAESAAERAVSLAPHSARAAAIRADLGMRQLKREPGTQPADWITLRRDLQRAIQFEPDDPYALMIYFRSFLNEPVAPVTSAYAAMDRAFALQPESIEIRVLQIYALSLRGRYDEARQLARALASDPHSAELGKKALASLGRIEAASKDKMPVGSANAP